MQNEFLFLGIAKPALAKIIKPYIAATIGMHQDGEYVDAEQELTLICRLERNAEFANR